MLSLSNVCLNGKLKNISFSIEKQNLCVVSASQDNISALADVICGVKRISDGHLETNGKVPLFTRGADLPSHLTVKEYFDAVMALSGAKALPEIVYEASKKLLGRRIVSLKASAKARVGALSLLIPEAEYVFAQSPTAGLDPEEAERVTDILFSDLHSSYVIYGAESLTDMKKADLVLALDKGKSIFFGTPDELIEKADENGTTVALVMGSREKLEKVTENLEADIEKTEKDNVYAVRFTNGFSASDIKKLLKGSGITFLEAEKENAALKKLVSLLTKKDKSKKENLELKKAESAGPKKIDISLTAFNRELDENPYEEEDVDEEEQETSESTLFSGRKE